MFKNTSLALALVLALGTSAYAKVESASVTKGKAEMHQDHHGDDNFPKGYFLIPHNLPFALGLVLKHPKSDTLALTKEQKDKLMGIMKETKPGIMTAAKKIKALEIKLRMQLVKDGKKASDLFGQVDEIAKLKADLTKKHLLCIESVRATLTPEQRKKVQVYAHSKEEHTSK